MFAAPMYEEGRARAQRFVFAFAFAPTMPPATVGSNQSRDDGSTWRYLHAHGQRRATDWQQAAT
eukprot:11176875-Lingulodinium_polyedra.AAC.1